MYYYDKKCPVCNQPFNQDSDIVVCPECGTPHHRECYIKNNGCANADRHGSGYSYNDEYPSVQKEDKQEQAPQQVPPQPKLLDVIYGKTDDGETNNNGQAPFFGFFAGEAVKEDTDIGGITAGEYSAFLGGCAFKYIPRFMILQKFNKKVFWNILAFFFPFTFAAYKKMYKPAIILLTLDILFFGFGAYNSLHKAPVKAVGELFVQVYADGVLTDDESELLSESVNKLYSTETPAEWTDYVLDLRIVDNIFMGLFATYLYMKSSEKKIRVLKDASLPGEIYNRFLRKIGKGALLLPAMGYILLCMTVFAVAAHTVGF